MTGNHRDTSITRRRALVVTGGTVAAGGLAAAGYQSAFADDASTTTASASTASATSTSGACMTLMSSVTQGPYYLDGALVRKNITEGKSGVPLTLRLTVVDATDGCTPVPGAAVEIWHCDAWGYYSGYRTLAQCSTLQGGGEGHPARCGLEGRSGMARIALSDNGVVRPTAGRAGSQACGGHVRPTLTGRQRSVKQEPAVVLRSSTDRNRLPSGRRGRQTTLDDDMVYDGGGAASGLLTLKAVHKSDPSKGYKGSLTLGVDPDAENTGAGSGGGGTPPSGAPNGAPSGAPTGAPPSGGASPSAPASS
ncbi:protocatechuate dioxygenase [Streptomyces sp. NPDC005263]|uniref:protocatechuate dioxygenase n=1 Tax=Streptomyces sp. NPDC005263 TaxID=3364711 RepID=UPI0036A2AEA7